MVKWIGGLPPELKEGIYVKAKPLGSMYGDSILVGKITKVDTEFGVHQAKFKLGGQSQIFTFYFIVDDVLAWGNLA